MPRVAAAVAVVAVILLAQGGGETDGGAASTQTPTTPPVSFKATVTGIFEIELEHSGTQLASLKVLP